jgi:hypothetical protein
MMRIKHFSVLVLLILIGCGRTTGSSPSDLSAYTNIPPGTHVLLFLRVQDNAPLSKSERDNLSSMPLEGVLVSINKDVVELRLEADDQQPLPFGKEVVKSIRTNTPVK